MLKDTTYKEKFAMLKSWMPYIVDQVKKDLKNDHLKNDVPFTKLHFGSVNINKLTTEDLANGYLKAIADEESSEALGEFIANRWLLKNTELYNYFERKLSSITENFTDLEVLDTATSKEIMEGAITEFGAPKTYLFSVINSVVFPKEIFDQLGAKAECERNQQSQAIQSIAELASIEAKERAYEQQIARLTDKYEKKLLGMQSKYDRDITALKKQVAALQKKMAG